MLCNSCLSCPLLHWPMPTATKTSYKWRQEQLCFYFCCLCVTERLRLAKWKYFQLLLRGQITLHCVTWAVFLQSTLNKDRSSSINRSSHPEQLISGNKIKKKRNVTMHLWVMDKSTAVLTGDSQFSRFCDLLRSCYVELIPVLDWSLFVYWDR